MKTRMKNYLKLIKSMQTGLLLVTGVAGYVSANCPIMSWQSLLSLAGSLFLAIAGSTILNMVWDRDIDSKMSRTSHRPLVTGEVRTGEALTVGLLVSAIGIGWAFFITSH